jgi:hypothetical protein
MRTFLSGFGQVATQFAHLFEAQVADEGLAVTNELDRPVMQLPEVIRCVKESLAPVEAEPADVFLDRFRILGLFSNRVGVVESQVAKSPEFLGYPKVQTDTLGMAQVEVSVRFGGESSMYPSIVLSALLVLLHPGADEVEWFVRFFLISVFHLFVISGSVSIDPVAVALAVFLLQSLQSFLTQSGTVFRKQLKRLSDPSPRKIGAK